MAKDDPIPGSATDKTVSAVGDAEAGHAEATAAAAASVEADAKPSRRPGAPHLRVIQGDADPAAAAASDEVIGELPPLEPPPVPEVLPNQRIGAAIRSKRETLGYSLDQVSKDTRVHLSHLRAIEEMTPNLLGAPVYAKGYIRAYARYLGLDEMSTLERYLRECAILKDPEKQEIAPPTTGRRLPSAAPVLGFLIIALVGAAGYFLITNNNGNSASDTVAATTGAVPAPGAATGQDATAAAVPVQQLQLVALRRSMLDVRTADGTKISRRYFEPGDRFLVRVGAGWTVSALEDASAFEWKLGDKSLGLMGPDAVPLNAQSVDIAATRPPIEAPLPPAPELTDAQKLGAAQAIPAPAAAAGAAPVPAKPRARPRPAAAAPSAGAAQETAPPTAAATTPPAQAPTQPATPAQDPALLAYPQ